MDLFDGVTVVRQQGRTIFESAVGAANREWRVPHTSHSRFRVGSVTKAATAILALQFAERGLLDLDAPVSRIVPDSVFPHRLSTRFTTRQLLIHRSGLPDFNNVPDFFRQMNAGLPTEREILQRIGHYDLKFEPGSRFGYGNDAYYLVGAILERLSGRPFADLLREQVLVPAGMSASGISRVAEVLPQRASGYRWTGLGVEHAAPYAPSPASGMYASAGDVARFVDAVARGGLVSPASRATLWAPTASGNAYGWQVHRDTMGRSEPTLLVESDGAVPGFYARVLHVPAHDLTVVALTNVRGPRNRLGPLVRALAHAALGGPAALPKPSLAVAARTRLGLASWPADSLRARYDVDEFEINLLGYALLAVPGRASRAVEVFAMNVRLFPNSVNVHDSMADAFLAVGDTTSATAAVRRALRLAPRSEALKRRLRALGDTLVNRLSSTRGQDRRR